MQYLLPIVLLVLSGCTTLPSPEKREAVADHLAQARDWHAITLQAGAFNLVAYLPSTKKLEPRLTVYIEGDGFAWASLSQPSLDPTPLNPIGLKLALAHPNGNVAYLARPCQYVSSETSGCPQRYWTHARFSPEVIEAESAAISQLKRDFNAHTLTLVGYSGGGAVAALVAARRTDVTRLITVAGNLDPQAWALYQHIQPLIGSLDPVDEIEPLSKIKQWYFVGGKDSVIPPTLVMSFANRFPSERRPVVIVEPLFDHQCCWVENWAQLIEQIH